jgi:plasmid stability protein
MEPQVSLWSHSMTVTFSIKGVPEELAARLRLRAAAHRRSLQRELMTILEAAASAGDTPGAGGESTIEAARPGPRSFEEVLARIRSRRGRRSAHAVSSASLVRDMRDHRYGEPPTTGAGTGRRAR